MKRETFETQWNTLKQFIWLIDCMVFSKLFQLYRGGQYIYLCFPGVILTSTLRTILSKPLAAFPHNHCRNNWQRWQRNESCRNDYHQSSERTLAEPGIKPATSCSLVLKATDWAMELSRNSFDQAVNLSKGIRRSWVRICKTSNNVIRACYFQIKL